MSLGKEVEEGRSKDDKGLCAVVGTGVTSGGDGEGGADRKFIRLRVPVPGVTCCCALRSSGVDTPSE